MIAWKDAVKCQGLELEAGHIQVHLATNPATPTGFQTCSHKAHVGGSYH
jgi:hypothetical protein